MKTHNSHQQSNRRAELDVLIASWPFCTESVTMRSQRTLVRRLCASPDSAQTGSSVNRVNISAFWPKALLLTVLLLRRIVYTSQSAARQCLVLGSNAKVFSSLSEMAN